MASLGLGNRKEGLETASLARGAGKSAGVILRRPPGASVRQSPYAAWPVRTSVSSAATLVIVPTKAKATKPTHRVRIGIRALQTSLRGLGKGLAEEEAASAAVSVTVAAKATPVVERSAVER